MSFQDLMSIQTSGEGTAGYQAAARLEGLDILNVFDLDKTGTIHQVVLARSLHIFDQSVFTPPVVQELVDILASMVPDRTDGRVPVQTLVDLMAQPEIGPERVKEQRRLSRRLSRRSTLTEQICEALEIFTDSLVNGIRGFREVVSPDFVVASSKAAERTDRQRYTCRSKAKKYVMQTLRQNVCPLWNEYDKVGSGSLDPSEVPPLVAAYLHVLASISNQLIRTSVEMAMELSLFAAEQVVKDQSARQQIQAYAKLQVDAIHASVGPKTQEMLEMMANEESQTIAGELIAEMQAKLEPSGRVPRDAFESTFVEGMQYVLGPGPFVMDKLQRINSLP